MGLLKLSENKLLLIGGEENFKNSNSNKNFFNFPFEENKSLKEFFDFKNKEDIINKAKKANGSFDNSKTKSNTNNDNNDNDNNIYNNSLRFISIDDNGNIKFKYLDCENAYINNDNYNDYDNEYVYLSKFHRNNFNNFSFSYMNNFIDFEFDENYRRFYCFNYNNELCKIDLDFKELNK
jgi:hypothetical protein